jgi:hypothetical protein
LTGYTDIEEKTMLFPIGDHEADQEKSAGRL